MKIKRQQLSSTKVKLTIELDKAWLDDAEKVALTKLKKDLKAPGFRKGKVPVAVAKKQLDPNLLAQETAENAISKAVAKAFTDENIQALERPQVEMVSFVPGQELKFTAEALMIPEIKLGDYKKLKPAKRPAIKVEQKEVDEIIERILQQMAEKKPVKRAAKDGDEVTIDFVGKKDGKAFDGGTAKDYQLVLGSKSFIPGFEEAVVGHKVGDKFDAKLTFPKDYHAKNLAGAKVVFEVKLNKIQEVVTPKLTDEIAAKAGDYTSADELTSDIKSEIKRRKQAEQQDGLKDELIKKLIEKSQVDAPEILVEDQIRSIEQDLTQNLMYRGISFEDYLKQRDLKDRDAWVKAEARQLAEDRVKSGLIIGELTKAEKITATNQELEAQIAEFKKQYASQPEMAKRFDEPEVQREIANRLLSEKTIDRLVELNTK
ncbi:trigger factor [Candidatus Saccharibacteria bacterium]|nr:MAG: trigger factor [Candidatus Saccharibacteria bacterium]